MATRGTARSKTSEAGPGPRTNGRGKGGGSNTPQGRAQPARPLSETATTAAGDAALSGRAASFGPAGPASAASPGGQPLPQPLLGTLESGLGQDLTGLRVHQGDKANQLTGALGTAAATRGSDLYFGPGQFRPNDPSGQRIIAHEAAHAADQRATGQTRLSAWPGPPEATPLARAQSAISDRAQVLLRAGLSAEETPDLITGLHNYIDDNHENEVSDDERARMHIEVDELSALTAPDPDPSMIDPIGPVGAVTVLSMLLGLPRQVVNDFAEVSFGVESFIRWCARGVAQLVTRPIGAEERDFAEEFLDRVQEFTDPWSLMNLELEATIDELVWLRQLFNGSTDATERASLGEQISVAARRVLLLNDAMGEMTPSTAEEASEETPLDVAIERVQPRIDAMRREAQYADTTLERFNNQASMLRSQRVEAEFPVLQEEPAATTVHPEEAFPIESDAAVENLTDDLARRVTSQASDVNAARELVLPSSPTYSLAEALNVYRRWFQFYSPRGRDQDELYQMVDNAVVGFSDIANRVDEGAFLHPLLMSQWRGLVSMSIGTAQADFASEIPRVTRRSSRVGGDAYGVQYNYAEMFSGTRGGLSAEGERSSRSQVLNRERANTRAETHGRRDAWTYVINTEQWDESITQETKYLDPATADYLLARRQALAALERAHTPGVGDSRSASSGIEHGQGTGAQRFIDGEANTATNRTVQGNHATVENTAQQVGAGNRDDLHDRTSSTDVTQQLINDLTEYLDTFFASEADVAEKLTLTLLISDAEYGSFASIRDALTPAAIAQGLAMGMGMKGLEIAMTRLASRAVADTVMRGLGRALTFAFGSDISQMAQLGTFLFSAAQTSTLHEARTMAYFGRAASTAIGNLLQSLIVSTAMSPIGRGMELSVDALARYNNAQPPRTVREMTNMLGPFTKDPAAREMLLNTVREDIARLEADADPNSSNLDLEILRSFEADLSMRNLDGAANAADMVLQHDNRSPAERMEELLQRDDLSAEERMAIEEAIAAAPTDAPAADHRAPPSRELGDPALMAVLGAPGVPVTRDASWDSAGVRVEYTTREILGVTLVNEIHVRAGAHADPATVALHGRTVRRLQRLQGLAGGCRAVMDRFTAAWSNVPETIDRPGSVGFEVRAEIDKLPGLIQVQQARLDAYISGETSSPLNARTAVELNAHIASLQQQLRFYEAVANDVSLAAEGGRFYIAALDYQDDFGAIYSRGGNVALIETAPGSSRPHSGEATITEDFGSSRRRDNATEVGATHGISGDHGGHVFAHRFFGDVPDAGIVPQAGNLNTGAWKKMENEWAGWVNQYGPRRGVDVEIFVYVELNPPGAARPTSIDVVYEVAAVHSDGTRESVHFLHNNFANQSGQQFRRLYFQADGTPYHRR